MIMRDTVFCAIPADADTDAITASIEARVAEVQRYVPGYTLRAEPQYDEARESWNGNARVAVFLEVRGGGDYLPEYAGNLDIMTAAAARVGEVIAQRGPGRSGGGRRGGDGMTAPAAAGARQLRITDTTLRDGSHAMAHQFTEGQVRATVHALDAAGVAVIEVTHGDGLGGSSFNYGFSRENELTLIKAGADEATQAAIAVLLVPGIGTMDDLRGARDAGASVARVATHCTEADVSIQHFGLARELGMETVGFLMMAHRTSPAELARQARIMTDAGAQCVYCVDSAGALVLGDAQERVQAMVAELRADAEVGFHGHQNLSLGVANSVLAFQHGARQIDGALCALGAGAATPPPRSWPPPSTTWASRPAWTWAAYWRRRRR